VKKAVKLLPVVMAEEARLKTVRILRESSKLKDNLTGTERRELSDLTILLADKVSATVVLNTVDYNHKIGALLQDQMYRRLAKDPTEAVKHTPSLLFKRSTLADEVCK
jgi:hypothetical protein